MIQQALQKIAGGTHLSYQEAYGVMDEMMSGQASDVLMGSYLSALALLKETSSEISGSAAAMRDHAAPFPVADSQDLLEIVGTGGDHSNSFNISTTSAFVLAAAGCKVAKHGNRAASSKSGAADCLEALGVVIDVTPQKAADLLDSNNMCFLFAPVYHPAMKYAAPIRRELGIRTIFNVLGPLTNPAHAGHQMLGVCSPDLVDTMADALQELGVTRGLVVYGQDVLDEISVCAPTTVCEFGPDGRCTYEIAPEDFGYPRATADELVGGSPAENAQITRDILSGKEQGARRHAVCMNAGAALYLDGKADSIGAGCALAEEMIDSGQALARLNAFAAASRA